MRRLFGTWRRLGALAVLAALTGVFLASGSKCGRTGD